MKSDFLGLAVVAVLATTVPALAKCGPNDPTPTPLSRYTIKGGEVYDTKTNLTWARCSVGQQWKEGKGCVGAVKQMIWAEAQKQAKDGWRVPTMEELATLSAPTCKPKSMPNLDSVAINDDAFPNMELPKLGYWTSTEYGAHYAWAVHFGDEHDNYQQNGMRKLSVRLVRSGK